MKLCLRLDHEAAASSSGNIDAICQPLSLLACLFVPLSRLGSAESILPEKPDAALAGTRLAAR